MPIPTHAHIVNGGCNCGAIRYKISIPDISKRPLHPSTPIPTPIPFTVIDNCNDCRRATASMLPMWFCAPTYMVTTSVVLRSDASSIPPLSPSTNNNPSPSSTATATATAPETEKRTAYLPASEIFVPGPQSAASFLTFFKSSEGKRRTFCGRCGTNLSYEAFPMPEGWPDMLDLTLGSVDRTDLEGGGLRPDRQLWCHSGIGWVKELIVEGKGEGEGKMLKHPDYRFDVFVE